MPSSTWRATSIIRDRVPMAVFWMKPKASDSDMPRPFHEDGLGPVDQAAGLELVLGAGRLAGDPSATAWRASASMAHSCSHRAMAWSMAGISSIRWNGLTR